MRASSRLRGLQLCLLFAVCLASHAKVAAQVKALQPVATITVPVEADGTVDLPAETVPMSKFLSLEGKAYLNQHLHDMQDPSQAYMEKGIPRFMVPYFERQKVLFAVHRSTFSICTWRTEPALALRAALAHSCREHILAACG